MKFECVLISEPSVDFATFLSIANTALGYSPAAQSDASGRELNDSERFLSCLAAVRDREAAAGMVPDLLGFVHFSLLLIAEAADLISILSFAPQIAFVTGETLADDIYLAVGSGSLTGWREAVKHGAGPLAPKRVRQAMLKIKGLFDHAGLSTIWSDLVEKPTSDRAGYYLEDKSAKGR